MDLKDKKVLVIGLKKTGLALIQALLEFEAEILAYDGKEEGDMDGVALDFLRENRIESYFGQEPKDLPSIDLAVTSPGVPLTIDLLEKLRKQGTEIIGEVEFAYRLGKAKYIGITGTNGKTTTTALTGAIMKALGFKTEVAGNIGNPLIEKVLKADEDTWMVAELSSFQLETTRDFHAEIALLLNLSPDHLDRHGTFENYVDAKKKIFANQGPEDYFIYNYDDPLCREIGKDLASKALGFSLKEKLDFGAYIDQDHIVIADEQGIVHKICPLEKLKIRGSHNVENALAAAAAGFFATVVAGTDPSGPSGPAIPLIEKALEAFPGVAHRLEDLGQLDGISFINDSKGTNADSSIKAIEAIATPIILIAGGFDKGASYYEFVRAFGTKVKALVLIGATAENIKATALEEGFPETHIYIEEDMGAAVNRAYGLGQRGDTVLLSPACASWGMYEDFEKRGDDFRSRVEALKTD